MPQDWPLLVRQLFAENGLWDEYRRNSYIPAVVVKSTFCREDGCPVDPKQFSVFIHNLILRLSRDDRAPVNYIPKQRHQIWDYSFVHSMFRYLHATWNSPAGNVNKLAYITDYRVSISDLYIVRSQFIDSVSGRNG